MVNNFLLNNQNRILWMLASISITLNSMERPNKNPFLYEAQPESCQFFATPDNIIGAIAYDISMVGKGGYIGIESPHFSHKLIIHELIKASKRDVRIRIFTNQASAETLKLEFANAPIQVNALDNLHAKRIVINNGKEKIVWHGSMNLSEHASQNHEIMMRCTDPSIYLESHGDQFRLGQSFYNREIAPVNFSERRMINSLRPEASHAKLELINSFGVCRHPHDYLYFVAYSFDDMELFNALLSAKKQTDKPIIVLVDRKTWKNINARYDILKPLVDTGIQVYVFNKNEDKQTSFDYFKDMHIKAILRKCNQECNAMISSANFTLSAREQINHDLWEPCSLNFAKKFKNFLDQIKSESIKLSPRDFPVLLTPEQKTQRLKILMKYPTNIHQHKDEIIWLVQNQALEHMPQQEQGALFLKTVSANQPEVAIALINARVNVNFTDEYNTTALHYAADNGNTEVAELLLNSGAEIDFTDRHGNSALFKAINAGNIRMVKLLINRGADVNLGGDYRVFGFRNEFSGTIPPLIQATKKKNIELIKLLIAAGADLNATDPEGFTALWHALKQNNAALITLLIQAGANINHQLPLNGSTPLMHAAQQSNYEMVKVLLNNGADLDVRDNMGRTARDYAKDKKIISLLDEVMMVRAEC